MIVLDIKLARHEEAPVFFGDSSGKYNWGKMPMPPGKILCQKEDIDLTRVKFVFPVMTDWETANRGYQLS